MITPTQASDSEAPPAVVQATDLYKRFGDHCAVAGVSFRVERGKCWGLLGPNGAGKTTLLRMLIGKTHPSRGSLAVLGHKMPQDGAHIRARIGVVPQRDNLDPDFSVTENLRIYAAYFGLSGAKVEERIQHLIRFAALEHKARASISVLSGGMQRRLSLSRALINQPELLVLDEPTTGLDPQARQLIWQRLRELKNDGMTIIMTTHYMDEAERLCDHITVMDHGKILDCDAPVNLINRHIPAHVVEVHGEGLAAWHQRVGQTVTDDSEAVGDGRYYYLEDERPLLLALHQQAQLRYLYRPANLEDVFLKLTGRDLRDD